MARTILGTKVDAGESFRYNAVLRDETGAAIDIPTDITALTLTMYRADTNVSLNSRLNQDVRGAGTGANEHVLDAMGNLIFRALPADTNIAGITADTNIVLRYTFTFSDGVETRTGIHEVQLTIQPLVTVT